jgi:membrane fusion protein (multidrug efflux system)
VDRELSPRTLTFKASVVLENPGERILPGVTAKVVLPRRSIRKAIVVPSEALLTESGGSFVMVALKREAAWVARKQAIKTGPAAGSDATVVREGLAGGEFLIVEGNHLTKDGSEISFDERLALASDARGN